MWVSGARAWRLTEVDSMTGKTVAMRLLVAILLVSLPALAGTGPASIAGSVITIAGRAPVGGAIIHLADIDTGKIFSSTPTTADGHFVLTDLPEATYRVAVAVDGGLYPVDTALPLSSAGTRTVTLAIKPQPGVKGVGSSWDNPVKASLIVIGAAVLLGVLVDATTTDEAPASEF
jgi:hypothetical protein